MRHAPHAFSLRQLQYVVAVADLRSFRRAAELCHVSQPSLSAQIAQVEEALGARLFERDRAGVLVTPAGTEIVARARALLVSADDLEDAAKRLGDPLSGTMRIGVIPTIAPYLLPELARALARELPRMTFVWVEDKTEPLVERLGRGELDAALVAMTAELRTLEHAVVGRDPFVLATAHTHPLGARRRAARAEELGDEPVLLLDDGHCLREQALAFCSRAGATELGFRATSLATLSQMVAGGAGVTLLPMLAVPTENRRGDLAIRRFGPRTPSRTLALVWRRGSPLGATLAALARTLRAEYEALLPRLEASIDAPRRRSGA